MTKYVLKIEVLLINFGILFALIMSMNYIASIIGIAMIIYVLFLIYTYNNPIKGNIICLVIWGSIQWILESIYISSLSLSQVSMFLVLPVLIVGILSRLNTIIYKKNNKLLLIYISLSLWIFLSVLTAPDKIYAMTLYLKVILGMLFFILFSNGVKKKDENEFIIEWIIRYGGICGLMSIIQLYLSGIGVYQIWNIDLVGMYYGGATRPVGTLGGPVASGILMFTTYILAMYKNDSNGSIINKIYIGLMIAGILATQTRTAILALGLSFILKIIFYVLNRKSIKKFLFVILIILLILIIFKENIYEMLIVRFDDLLNANSIDDLGAGRVGIWISVIKGIIEESNIMTLLIGNGIESAPYFVEKYSVFSKMDATHNDYLDMFVSSGIIGTIIYVYFLIILIKDIWNSRNFKVRSNFFVNMIVYYLVILSLSNTNYSSGIRWFLLITISYALNEIKFINEKET